MRVVYRPTKRPEPDAGYPGGTNHPEGVECLVSCGPEAGHPEVAGRPSPGVTTWSPVGAGWRRSKPTHAPGGDTQRCCEPICTRCATRAYRQSRPGFTTRRRTGRVPYAPPQPHTPEGPESGRGGGAPVPPPKCPGVDDLQVSYTTGRTRVVGGL